MAEKKSNIIDVEDLLIVWKFLGKNWLILLLFPLLSAVAAYLFVHRMPDEYGAKTEILLGTGSGYEYQSQIYRGLTGYGGGVSQLTNQIRVLKSHDLISNTLDKLDYQISYFIVGRVKTTEIPYIDAFSIDIKLIEGEGADLFGVPFDIKILDKKTFSLKFDNGLDTEVRTHEFNKDIVTNDYILRVDLNKLLSDDTFIKLKENDYQFIVNSKNYLIKKYKKSLEIENEEGTSILEISVKDHLGSKAKMFLDSLSATYIDYTIQSQIELNENTLEYIDRQLEGITYILDSIEDAFVEAPVCQEALITSRPMIMNQIEKQVDEQVNTQANSVDKLDNIIDATKTLYPYVTAISIFALFQALGSIITLITELITLILYKILKANDD